MDMTPVNTTLSWQSCIEEAASSTDESAFTLDAVYEQKISLGMLQTTYGTWQSKCSNPNLFEMMRTQHFSFLGR